MYLISMPIFLFFYQQIVSSKVTYYYVLSAIEFIMICISILYNVVSYIVAMVDNV